MIPALFVPKELTDAAREEARHVVDSALKGLFGIIDAQVKRRQSYAFAHEKAVFHEDLARRLRITSIRIIGKARKIRRHERLALRWGARAAARDPKLAQACSLCTTGAA